MRHLFTLILTVICLSGYSQINIEKESPCKELKEVNSIGYPIILSKCDGYYTVMFRDTRYQQIVEFESFIIDKEDIEQFKEIVLSGFNEGKEVRINLSGQTIILGFHSSMGVVQLRFEYFVNNSYLATSSYLGKRKAEKFLSGI